MKVIRHSLWLLMLIAIAVQSAVAAEGARKGPSEAIFIGEIVVLMLVGRLLGDHCPVYRPTRH